MKKICLIGFLLVLVTPVFAGDWIPIPTISPNTSTKITIGDVTPGSETLLPSTHTNGTYYSRELIHTPVTSNLDITCKGKSNCKQGSGTEWSGQAKISSESMIAKFKWYPDPDCPTDTLPFETASIMFDEHIDWKNVGDANNDALSAAMSKVYLLGDLKVTWSPGTASEKEDSNFVKAESKKDEAETWQQTLDQLWKHALTIVTTNPLGSGDIDWDDKATQSLPNPQKDRWSDESIPSEGFDSFSETAHNQFNSTTRDDTLFVTIKATANCEVGGDTDNIKAEGEIRVYIDGFKFERL